MRIIIISSSAQIICFEEDQHGIYSTFCRQQSAYVQKTFSYYIMHITVAMLVGYFVTGSLTMAIALSLLEPTVQAVAFFHEKIWEAKASNRMRKSPHNFLSIFLFEPPTLGGFL